MCRCGTGPCAGAPALRGYGAAERVRDSAPVLMAWARGARPGGAHAGRAEGRGGRAKGRAGRAQALRDARGRCGASGRARCETRAGDAGRAEGRAVRHTRALRDAQRRARDEQKGTWSERKDARDVRGRVRDELCAGRDRLCAGRGPVPTACRARGGVGCVRDAGGAASRSEGAASEGHRSPHPPAQPRPSISTTRMNPSVPWPRPMTRRARPSTDRITPASMPWDSETSTTWAMVEAAEVMGLISPE